MNVIVLAPHPDDETLGCGGTLLRYKENGDKIFWLIGTKICKKNGYSNKEISKRENEINKVCEKYEFDGVEKLNIPATKVDDYSIDFLITLISNIINKIKPNIIFLPFKDDIHSDHRIFFNAGYSCTKNFRYSFINKILMMEIISETEFAPSVTSTTFIPNVFINITDFMEKKIEIIKIFESEIKNPPFPRSIENIKALATFRGAQSGFKFSESFMLLKEVI
jgi:N-acetylglucosamine malate deacetylase 1